LGSCYAVLEFCDTGFEGFDARVAGQVVYSLGGDEDVALEVVHYGTEAFGECEPAAFLRGGEVVGGDIFGVVLGWQFGNRGIF